MKRTVIAIIIILIVIISVFLTFFAMHTTVSDNATVIIYSDGAEVYRSGLITENADIPIENNGHKNIVRISNGNVSMIHADCPDRLCVKQGIIANGLYPIVCLPNKVTVKIVNDNRSADTPDIISR